MDIWWDIIYLLMLQLLFGLYINIHVHLGFYIVWKTALCTMYKHVRWEWECIGCLGQRPWTKWKMYHICIAFAPRHVLVNCFTIVLLHWMYESDFTVMYIYILIGVIWSLCNFQTVQAGRVLLFRTKWWLWSQHLVNRCRCHLLFSTMV